MLCQTHTTSKCGELEILPPPPPGGGTLHEAPPPELVEREEEFEVEDILAHRLVGPSKQSEFLVHFKGYEQEDDLWLPQCNLEHAQDIL